jgi:ribosomal protein L22
MEVKAIHRGARISAQKTRLVADQIRGSANFTRDEHSEFQP